MRCAIWLALSLAIAVTRTAAGQPIAGSSERATSGDTNHSWFGARVLGLTSEEAARLGGKLIVAAVNPSSPAARAGLREGDLILSFDGRQLLGVNDLSLV